MRTKDKIMKEINHNFQPGAFGGIPPDVKDRTLIEVLIDIRDVLVKLENRQGKALIDPILGR